VGPPVHPALTTRVVQFNDVEALEQALRAEDVACVLAEPALTNIGIVLPDDGFHEALRELTRSTGTLLAIDETHTLSAGPGGCTHAWNLEPDLVTVGKAIGGGMPAAAFGVSAELAERITSGPRPTTRTPAGSAAPWPETRSPSPPSARRSSTCSPRTRSTGRSPSQSASPPTCRRRSTTRASRGT
jgi:glutamate-1-semialdehyde aminotransferase